LLESSRKSYLGPEKGKIIKMEEKEKKPKFS
jgi:hypothetical protein